MPEELDLDDVFYIEDPQPELIMKTNKPPLQPIALPHGRGKSITLQHIMEEYTHHEVSIIDFRIPLLNEGYLDTRGNWRTQSFAHPIHKPRLILKSGQQ